MRNHTDMYYHNNCTLCETAKLPLMYDLNADFSTPSMVSLQASNPEFHCCLPFASSIVTVSEIIQALNQGNS